MPTNDHIKTSKKESEYHRRSGRVHDHQSPDTEHVAEVCEGKSPVSEDLSGQSHRASIHLPLIKQMISEAALLDAYATPMPRDVRELRARYINALYYLLDLAEEELGLDHPAAPEILRAASEFELMLYPFDYAMSNDQFVRDIDSVLGTRSVLDKLKSHNN